MDLNDVPRPARLLLLVGGFYTAAMMWISVSALGYGDFPQLHASAQAFVAGRDLYATGPTIQGTSNLNPPHLAILMAPLGALSLPWAAVAMSALILMAAGMYAAAAARAIPTPDRYTALGVISVSAASAVAVSLINVAWPLGAATAWAWVWRREGLKRRSALVIGCLASFKLFFLLFVPYWAWRRDFVSITYGAIAFCAVIAAGASIVGLGPYLEWVSVLQHGSPLLSVRPLDASWHSIVTRLPVDSRSALAVWLTGSVVAVAVSWWRLRRETDIDLQWALLLTAMIILSPLGWVYYTLIPALPVAAVMLRSQSKWVTVLMAACAIVPPILVVSVASQMQQGMFSAIANSFYALSAIGVWLALMTVRTASANLETSVVPSNKNTDPLARAPRRVL